VALALVVAASLALWRLKWGVIQVIAASAAAGLLLRWLALA
jgi:chromate transporter